VIAVLMSSLRTLSYLRCGVDAATALLLAGTAVASFGVHEGFETYRSAPGQRRRGTAGVLNMLLVGAPGGRVAHHRLADHPHLEATEGDLPALFPILTPPRPHPNQPLDSNSPSPPVHEQPPGSRSRRCFISWPTTSLSGRSCHD
jgi:hypothetical protein